MALVVRPLLAEISAEYSQIPSEMNAYCTLTIHQQRKYTSMYSFNGNQANWEDIIIFDIADPQSNLWVELWIQQFGIDRKIGEGHIDLKKHYHRSSYRQSERMELRNMEKLSGVLRLTIEYKSSKQDIQKLKRKLQTERQVIQVPKVEVDDPNPVLKKPVSIDKTPSMVYYHPNSMEQSICGEVDTAGYAMVGPNMMGQSYIDNESLAASTTEIFHPKPEDTPLLQNRINNVGNMTPQEYFQYVQDNQISSDLYMNRSYQNPNGQTNYQNQQAAFNEQNYQAQVNPFNCNGPAQKQMPQANLNQYQQPKAQQPTQNMQYQNQQQPQLQPQMQPQVQLQQQQLQLQQQQLQLQQQQKQLQPQLQAPTQPQAPNMMHQQMLYNQNYNLTTQRTAANQFTQQGFYPNNVMRR